MSEAGNVVADRAWRAASLRPVIIYTLVALCFVPVYPHFVSPNEFSRWAVAASLFEHRSVEISSVLPILGSRLEDLSAMEGRTYSNKAPGIALLAFPGYAIARLFVGAPSPRSLRPSMYLMRWFGATLPLLVLALFFRIIAIRLGVADSQVRQVLLLLLFGTPLFAYGLLLFSHALVAAALFCAWGVLFIEWDRREKQMHHEFLAGALLGMAVLSEYPAALPALILVAGILWRRGWRSAFRVVLGGLPFAVILGLYNQLAFDSPWALSSGFERDESFRMMASSGLFGIRFPSVNILFQLLLSPSRGLFIFTPVLIISVLALPRALRSLPRESAWTLMLVPLSLLFLFAGYPNWHGGWSVGSRYLVAALPFLLFPMLFASVGRIERILAGASVCASMITAIVFPFVPPSFAFPWASFSLPLIRSFLMMPNVGHLLGWWAAAVILSLLLIGVGWASGRRYMTWFASGFVLWMLVGLLGWRDIPARVSLQRDYIAEVYLEQQGAMSNRLVPGATSLRLLQRMAYEKSLPPTSWPFR